MYYKPGTHICSSEKHTTRVKPTDVHALHIIATMEIMYRTQQLEMYEIYYTTYDSYNFSAAGT